VVSFDRNDYTINEADGTVTVGVKLDKPAFAPVSVNFSTADDTAFGTADYVPTSGTLAFAVGESSKTFGVIVLNDNVDDPDSERVRLALSGVTGATIGVGNAAVIIGDDDPEPVLNFDSAAYVVKEDGAPIFKVVLDRPSGKDINFLYGPNGNGAATSGLDYLPTFNANTLSPDVSGVGPTFVYVTWSGLVDDTLVEPPPNETIEIELGSLINVAAGFPITTTLEIIDND
jgi:hypothetical protein